MRDRLIELIQESVGGCARNWAEVIAQHLLENGVILPPVTLEEKIKEAARLRYNNGRSLQEIGEIMGYSTRQIGRFLKRFEEER